MRLTTLALLAAVGACSHFQDAAQIEGNIIRPGSFRAGSGVIESVGVLPNANKAGLSREPHLYRLSLHMDVGGFQQVDVDNASFMAGEAVELTNDGRVVRVTGTSLNRAVGR